MKAALGCPASWNHKALAAGGSVKLSACAVTGASRRSTSDLRRSSSSLALRRAGNEKGKEAGEVADLETCVKPGAYNNVVEQALLDSSGSGENGGEDERTRRDEN